MKNIFLGAFVALMASTNLFASNEIKKENKIEKMTFACYSTTITNHVNQNGDLMYTTQSPKTEISCGGAPDGTVVVRTTVVQHIVEDINP